MKSKKSTNAPKKDSKRSKGGIKVSTEEVKNVKAGGFRPAVRHTAW